MSKQRVVIVRFLFLLCVCVCLCGWVALCFSLFFCACCLTFSFVVVVILKGEFGLQSDSNCVVRLHRPSVLFDSSAEQKGETKNFINPQKKKRKKGVFKAQKHRCTPQADSRIKKKSRVVYPCRNEM